MAKNFINIHHDVLQNANFQSCFLQVSTEKEPKSPSQVASSFLNDLSPTNPPDFYNWAFSLHYSHTFIPLSLYSHSSPPHEIPPPLLYQSFYFFPRPVIALISYEAKVHCPQLSNFTEKDQEKWSSLPRVHMVKQ